MACGGDWLKSDLVMESKDSKETTKFGRWKTMSRLVTPLKLAEHNYLYSYSLVLGSSQNCKDLMDRYKEKDLVDDLIQRKTEQKMYQADENFPTNEVDPACFLILVINIMRSYHQKTWSNKYIPVQPFCQDLRVYWVWDTCHEEDAKRHIESVGVTSRGAGAGKIAGNLVLEPQNH